MGSWWAGAIVDVEDRVTGCDILVIVVIFKEQHTHAERSSVKYGDVRVCE